MSNDLTCRFEQLLVGHKRQRPGTSHLAPPDRLGGAEQPSDTRPSAQAAALEVGSYDTSDQAMKAPRCSEEETEARRAKAERLAAAYVKYNRAVQQQAENKVLWAAKMQAAWAVRSEAYRALEECELRLAAIKRRNLRWKTPAAEAPAAAAAVGHQQHRVQA